MLFVVVDSNFVAVVLMIGRYSVEVVLHKHVEWIEVAIFEVGSSYSRIGGLIVE